MALDASRRQVVDDSISYKYDVGNFRRFRYHAATAAGNSDPHRVHHNVFTARNSHQSSAECESQKRSRRASTASRVMVVIEHDAAHCPANRSERIGIPSSFPIHSFAPKDPKLGAIKGVSMLLTEVRARILTVDVPYDGRAADTSVLCKQDRIQVTILNQNFDPSFRVKAAISRCTHESEELFLTTLNIKRAARKIPASSPALDSVQKTHITDTHAPGQPFSPRRLRSQPNLAQATQ